MKDFERAMKDMKVSELYELTDNLCFVDNDSVFSAAKKALQKSLSAWYDQVKKFEKGKKDHKYGVLHFEAYNNTGFEVFNPKSSEFIPDIRPSDFFKNLIDKSSRW